MRGEVFELMRPRNAMGHEQQGRRYCVVVQHSALPLSTLVVCPTSTSAQPASWRPVVTVNQKDTQVLIDQIMTVDPSRLGRAVAYLTLEEMQAVDRAIKLFLDLR